MVKKLTNIHLSISRLHGNFTICGEFFSSCGVILGAKSFKNCNNFFIKYNFKILLQL
jgi:hypothetical protein